MATLIIFLIIGVVVDVIIIRMHNKESRMPYVREWRLDEGVLLSDEVRAIDILMKYGRKNLIALSPTIVIPKDVREIVEQYDTLIFDDNTMDYARRDLLNGEETVDCWKGFYCIGDDGGEMSFYVRKSDTDEKIYAFDMEGSRCPEPYASNIRRFIIMRYNAWQATLKLVENEEKSRQRKCKIKKAIGFSKGGADCELP